MSGAAPKVSVLMTAHNGRRYLGEAIRSILGQTLCDFEFIIIDDGSTDDTAEVIRGYAERDRRIRWYSRSNRGLTPTLNEGLAMVRGQYVARMDADDVALPERLEKQANFLDEHPEVLCVGSSFYRIDEAGRRVGFRDVPVAHDAIDQEMLGGGNPFCHPAVMMRVDRVLAAGGYDIGFERSQDLDLWLRLAERGKLANLPERLLCYRVHGGAVSASRISEHVELKREALRRAWERRGLSGPLPELRPWRYEVRSRSERCCEMYNYGWGAYNVGCRRAMLVYGLRSVCTCPLTLKGWKLLGCGLIKPMPRQPCTGRHGLSSQRDPAG